MKAWNAFCFSPRDGCLLVYAENRNKARYIASRSLWEWEYNLITAVRVKDYDEYYDKAEYFETNDDLPVDAPAFYTMEDV